MEGISSIETRISGSTLEIGKWNGSDYCTRWAAVDPRTPQLLFVIVRPIRARDFHPSNWKFAFCIVGFEQQIIPNPDVKQRSLFNSKSIDRVSIVYYYCRPLRSVNFSFLFVNVSYSSSCYMLDRLMMDPFLKKNV